MAERRTVPPLDRPDERDRRRRCAGTDADQIDLRDIAARPPTADRFRATKNGIGCGQTGQRLPHQRLDRPSTVVRPRCADPGPGKIRPAALNVVDTGLDETQPEPQVRVRDPIAGNIG